MKVWAPPHYYYYYYYYYYSSQKIDHKSKTHESRFSGDLWLFEGVKIR
jgi:hypothetical protein